MSVSFHELYSFETSLRIAASIAADGAKSIYTQYLQYIHMLYDIGTLPSRKATSNASDALIVVSVIDTTMIM
jgi:hypothetical protein